LELDVTRDVLIPRPDTEVLVENVIRLARTYEWASPRILDLCAGSGCVAVAVAANLKSAAVTAVEISAAAAVVARRNVSKLKLDSRVVLVEGDLYAPLNGRPDGDRFHVIAANPPYIQTAGIAQLDKSVRDFEPIVALDGGPDGLSIHRRIWAGASDRLLDGGHVVLEIAFDQAAAALAALAEYPALTDARILKDYAGRDRVIAARVAATRGG
jgi:release factor glutamine methyltransferase